jgi:hypothetical protein
VLASEPLTGYRQKCVYGFRRVMGVIVRPSRVGCRFRRRG